MKPTLRTLRRNRGLTLTELAILSGIPARNLGAIELGVLSLDGSTRAHLASILAVAPHMLPHAPPSVASPPTLIDLQRLAIPVAVALTATTLATSLLSRAELPILSPLSAPAESPPAPHVVVVSPADRQPEAAPVGRAMSETFKATILNASVPTPARPATPPCQCRARP